MRIVAGSRYYRLPEPIEPNTAKLAVYHGHRSNAILYACILLQWPDFEELLARPTNRELKGLITTFAVSPNHREIHFFPLPQIDTDAVFRYYAAEKQI